MAQVSELHTAYDKLQLKYGAPELNPIYGCGDVNSPEIMFIFMNPTGKNLSSTPGWNGLRAPWVGTKQVWVIYKEVGLLDEAIYSEIISKKPEEWDVAFAEKVYSEIERNSVFITNLAKCTQVDARPLSNKVFKEYLELMIREIDIVKPKRIVTFGNQVSSILLSKPISVSDYTGLEKQLLNGYSVYPTYYPVGQGRRNMPSAIERIRRVQGER